MGMFSGCYLVLCGNEIASHLYHHPQTPEDPWPLLEKGPLGCQGTLTNWLPEKKKRLPGNCKYCKRNDWQEIRRSLMVRYFNPAKGVNSMSWRQFFFCWLFWLDSCYLDRMLNVWTRWNVKHEEKSYCEPWHLVKKDIRLEGKNLKKLGEARH